MADTESIDIVRSTLALFYAQPETPDDELITILETGGTPHAARAVTLVPIAFGRAILGEMGVQLSSTFLDDGHERILVDDPIYAAAEHIVHAEFAEGKPIEHVLMRSAEMAAVSKALDAGSDATDLMLASPVLSFAHGSSSGGTTKGNQRSRWRFWSL